MDNSFSINRTPVLNISAKIDTMVIRQNNISIKNLFLRKLGEDTMELLSKSKV